MWLIIGGNIIIAVCALGQSILAYCKAEKQNQVLLAEQEKEGRSEIQVKEGNQEDPKRKLEGKKKRKEKKNRKRRKNKEREQLEDSVAYNLQYELEEEEEKQPEVGQIEPKRKKKKRRTPFRLGTNNEKGLEQMFRNKKKKRRQRMKKEDKFRTFAESQNPEIHISQSFMGQFQINEEPKEQMEENEPQQKKKQSKSKRARADRWDVLRMRKRKGKNGKKKKHNILY